MRRPESSQVRALARLGAPVGDVSEPESMRAAMRGAQLVVHDAGHYEYGVDRAGMRRMRAVNVASPSRDRRLSRGPRATQPRPRVGVVRRIQSVPR